MVFAHPPRANVTGYTSGAGATDNQIDMGRSQSRGAANQGQCYSSRQGHLSLRACSRGRLAHCAPISCASRPGAGACADWESLEGGIDAWRSSGRVIYHQLIRSNAQNPDDRPWVLVIHDENMLRAAIKYSQNGGWAMDSTFGTNMWRIPLYAAVVAVEGGVGFPVFYMMSTHKKDSGERKYALKKTLSLVFDRMGAVRPRSITIDCDGEERLAIEEVVANDPYCWDSRRNQIAGHVIACWFHVKRAWRDNLMRHLRYHPQRTQIWTTLGKLMTEADEAEYQDILNAFHIQFSENELIMGYLQNNWLWGGTWDGKWQRHCRRWQHSHMETTNYVESHWRLLKVHVLRCKVNVRMYSLVSFLIGFPDGQEPPGGTILTRCMERWTLATFGRYSPRSYRRRRAGAQQLLRRLDEQPDSMRVVDRADIRLLVESGGSDDVYTVSMREQYCTCPSDNPVCKHLIACDLFLEQHEPDLWAQLYPGREQPVETPPLPDPPVMDLALYLRLGAELQDILEEEHSRIGNEMAQAPDWDQVQLGTSITEVRREISYIRDALNPRDVVVRSGYARQQAGARVHSFSHRPAGPTAARETPPRPPPRRGARRPLTF